MVRRHWTVRGKENDMIPLITVAIATLLPAVAAVTPCMGHPSAPALDHVVIAVRDLDRTGADFERHGFRLKAGRLHPNNLLNRHVKFRNGTSIELMTVVGEPGDAMAREYAELAAAGEGGVYVALRVGDHTAVQDEARALGFGAHGSGSGPWRFTTLPDVPAAAALFFMSGPTAQDADSLFSHRPATAGILEVWLEGGSEVAHLLERLGATRCGLAVGAEGETGERFGLGSGAIVLVPVPPGARPRVRGVVLGADGAAGSSVRPHAEFRVRYADPTDSR
jgi:hypothetical protein